LREGSKNAALASGTRERAAAMAGMIRTDGARFAAELLVAATPEKGL
jgi:hypothetical protein